MNLPDSVIRHVFATVALIFRCMAYVPERFPNNCNDRRLTEGQLLRSASVKGKPCGSPTKNGCANLTPLWLCWYLAVPTEHFGWRDGLNRARVCRRKRGIGFD